MIRDVVIHITNEQPILADLIAEPDPTAVALICRNVRTMGGKKPVFVDQSDSTFILSLAHIRFIEMPRASMEAAEAEREILARATSTATPAGAEAAGPRGRGARLKSGKEADAGRPAAPAQPAGGGREDQDLLDEELLRRIREV